MSTPGQRFREAVAANSPLPVLGTINAITALLAVQQGAQAIYLSGAGVANASCGIPDLGMTHLGDVVTDIERITAVCSVPLLVDADTGWGNDLTIARATQAIANAGAAGMHLEDQVNAKRCGHRPNKQLVSSAEMVARLQAAVAARTDPSFVIMARSDAFANEGLSGLIDRAHAYVAAGADMLFVEAVTELSHYQAVYDAVKVPILANITEFGRTPLFSQNELAAHAVAMALYPLTAFRAMNKAAANVYATILTQGSQADCLAQLQTRDELYQLLDYYHFEDQQ